MANYFTKTFKPDIIDGTVAKVIQSNKTDLPFSAGDILFDWVAVDVPRGTYAVVDATVHMFGEDGGDQTESDFNLLIAKSNNGVAPTTLGEENAGVTGCYELPEIVMGVMKFEGAANRAGKLNYTRGSFWHFNGSGNNGQHGPIVIEPESKDFSTRPAGQTQRIYVAGIAGGAIDFSTGVLVDGAITSDSATDITVKTVDPRKSFSVGDTVYLHDVDTALGTIASMDATSVILNAAIAGGTNLADEDELVNANPIRVTIGFEK